MKKRILSIVVALVMLFTLMPFAAFAETYPIPQPIDLTGLDLGGLESGKGWAGTNPGKYLGKTQQENGLEYKIICNTNFPDSITVAFYDSEDTVNPLDNNTSKFEAGKTYITHITLKYNATVYDKPSKDTPITKDKGVSAEIKSVDVIGSDGFVIIDATFTLPAPPVHVHADANKDNKCDDPACGKEFYIERTWDGSKIVETLKEIPADAVEITNSTTTLEENKVYIVRGNVTTGSIQVKGYIQTQPVTNKPSKIILCDGAQLTATGGAGQPGLMMPAGTYIYTLYVYGQANDTGKLVAAGGKSAAGIGGTDWKEEQESQPWNKTNGCGQLIVSGGNITATGGHGNSGTMGGAGIGGGYKGKGGTITVLGGKVTATGYDGAKGIGAGDDGSPDGELTVRGDLSPIKGTNADGSAYTKVTKAYTINNVKKESDKNVNHGYLAVEPSPAAEEGGTVTVTVNPLEGYRLKANSLTATGCTLKQDAGNTSKYTFTMPASDVTVNATFEVVPDVYIKHPWATGQDGAKSWQKMTEDSKNAGFYFYDGKWGGASCNINASASDTGASEITTANMSYIDEQGNSFIATPTIPLGTDVTFRYNSNDKKLTVVIDGYKIAPMTGEGYTIDYGKEIITVNAGYEISKSNSPFAAETLTDSKLTLEPGTTYYIRKAARTTPKTTPVSEATSFAVASRAEAPASGEGYSLDYDEEKVTVTTGYEISKGNSPFAAEKLTDNKLTLEPGTTYYIRKVATNISPASASASFAVPARPETPESAEMIEKTADSIKIKAVEGQEYSINDGTTWFMDGDEPGDGDKDAGTITFSGLSEKTKYSIITRVKVILTKGEESFRSENSNPSVITTKSAAQPSAASEPVDISGGEIKSGDNTVEVKSTGGETIPAEKLAQVAEAINQVLENTAVSDFGKSDENTGIGKAIEDSKDSIVRNLKGLTNDPNAVVEADSIKTFLDVSLASVDVDMDNTAVTSMEFEVSPMVSANVTSGGKTESVTAKVGNSNIKEPITFLLPVSSKITADTAAMYHEGEFMNNYPIENQDNSKYIKVSSTEFSKFGYITLDETTAGAKIGDTLYATLSDALAMVENDQTIVLLKDISGTVTVSKAVTFTIENNGMNNEATIEAASGFSITNEENTYKVTVRSGGGGMNGYTVKFETNGGSAVKSASVKIGGVLSEPEEPAREGFKFTGWYTDKDCTVKYEFGGKVIRGLTLYAGWEEIPADNSGNEIVLTIGKKSATVFGEEASNDVAPIIRNDRTMLPARFVAEALGADVSWDADEKKVTITRDDLTIILYIDSDKAYINEEEVILDSPAFIENDRTYTPLRFIAEALGAKVDWVEESQQVVITK